MRITTWNVNGLRAVLGKGALTWLQDQGPDVLCLQEIKARPEQIVESQRLALGEYHQIWHPADWLGYSGVATLLREKPDGYWIGLGEPRFDSEGRVIVTQHEGFKLFNVYFPSGQRGYDRVDFKLQFYAFLLEKLDRLHASGEQVVVCGDFNTAHNEIDLRNPKQNRFTSGFLPEERVWIDRYLDHGLVDAYRSLYPQRVQYTWWTYVRGARQRNVGWRLDYFLVSQGLMSRIRDVSVHDDILGSDHCPVSLWID